MDISVIIPTLDAAAVLESLVSALRGQTLPPTEIVVVDSESADGTARLARDLGCEVLPIARNDFNHGGTRNLAASRAQGDILVFMTQDALPVDAQFLGQLLHPLLLDNVAASFARQVAYPDATPSAKFAREFNYPATGYIRTRTSVETMGISAYFFSNVSSAIRKDAFMDVGMFAGDVIMNEDMLLCARLLEAGHRVAYAAKACVYHSHDYSPAQSFRRYFDIGVFFSRHPALSRRSATERGAAYTRGLLSAVARQGGARAVLQAAAEICAKFAGFNLGRLERFIPLPVKKNLSMHAGYWKPAQRGKAAP